MRLIEATFPNDCANRVREMVEAAEPVYYRLFEPDETGNCLLRVFFGNKETQKFVDNLQSVCEGKDGWRILVLPVEATAPALDEKANGEREQQNKVVLREEIYEDVAGGAAVSADFFISPRRSLRRSA